MLQYSPYALLIFGTTLISMWLAYAIWSRRPNPGIAPFVMMALALTLWTFASGVEMLLTGLEAKLVFTHLTYIGITIVPAAWLVFILQYTGHDKWITRRNLLLLTIEPILVQLLMLTNGSHHLFWDSVTLASNNGLLVRETVNGLGFWSHAIYSYVLLLISAFLLVRAFIRSPHLYRGQATFLLIAVLAPWIANAVFLLGFSPLPEFVDLTPLAFVITVIAVAWNMQRFRLMDIVPVARDIVVDNMDDGVFVVNQNNRIVDANRAVLKLLNRTFDEVVGQRAADVFAAQSALFAEFRDVEEADANITIPLEGQPRIFKLRITPLYNRQQILTGRIVVLHDVTQLQETNQALTLAREEAEEATRLKSQFLATMSHELRTPLNAIIGYTELQLTGMVGELSDIQYEYGERILANSQHLLGLINDILDLSKIEAGRMEVVKEPFSLRGWVDELIQQNAVLAEDKGIAFTADIDPSMPDSLIGDSARLRQIAVNLISNAVKFTHQGSVNLKVRPDANGAWAIVVSDTGIGIPPHKQETIFHEFHQVDNSSTREYGGTGLGLAIVRKLTLAMDGSIRVNSILGQGSTFTVILPLLEEPVANIVA